MEEAQEENTKLVSPASLDEQVRNLLSAPKSLDASLATFLDYLEAFYESLEITLEEFERKELAAATWSKPKPEYFMIKKQYEGQYQCPCDKFFFSMGYLIKLMYETMRKGSKSKQGAKPLTMDECDTMFICISMYAGFYNIFKYDYRPASIYSQDLRQYVQRFSPIDSPINLIDFSQPLTETKLQALLREALVRLHYDITCDSIYGFHNTINDPFQFVYFRDISSDEVDAIVADVLQGEIARFRQFIEALHGTLQFLADTAPLANTEIKLPIFNWDERKEALGIFKDTIQLLRTVGTGTVPTLQTNKVTPPTTVNLQVRKEEHTGYTHTYHLTLTDSRYLGEPVLFLLQVSQSGEAELFEDDSDG